MVRLETARLVVRQAGLKDAPAVAAFHRKNKDFHRPYEPLRKPAFYTQKFWREAIAENQKAARRYERLLLHVFREKEVIAIIAFNNIGLGAFQSCDLGYMLDEKSQGQGYMTEALEAAIRYLFEVENFHRIAAAHLANNKRSEKLLKRLGFARIGVAPKYLRICGRWQDHVLRSLINPAWRA